MTVRSRSKQKGVRSSVRGQIEEEKEEPSMILEFDSVNTGIMNALNHRRRKN